VALYVLCPECGKRYEVADEQAGGTGTCPACGTVARIPSLDAPIGGPPPQAGPPAYPPYTPAPFPAQPLAPAYGDQAYFSEMAFANFETHRRLLGIFGIIVGVLSMLWAGMCGLVIFLVMEGEMPNPPQEPELKVVAALYAVFGVLSIGTGILQIAAGISLLRRTRGCRKVGIVSGIISCVSMWGCFAWVFGLGYGVYALVILCGRNAIMAMEVRPAPGSPSPPPWGDGGPPQVTPN
jgi:hypothetical protein